MIKKGFTLAELLITVAVIGIVAAMTAPVIRGMVPDKKKTTYMKAYNTLTNLTSELLDNPGIYFPTKFNETQCTGLGCTAKPTIAPFNGDNKYSGNTKFGQLLAANMNLSVAASGNNPVTFTSQDGVQWTVVTNVGANGRLIGGSVTIDVDPNDNRNCTFSNNCQKPDRFTFSLDTYGGITPSDAMGKAYLQNPTDMNSTAEDLAAAKKFYSGSTPSSTRSSD